MTRGNDPIDRIKVFESNPQYWQYKGRPTLLVGGTDDENLFQWTRSDLIEQLDLLVSVGGNYDRCTMSGRPDRGFEIYPFARGPDGTYDLDGWNEVYWDQFQFYLQSCSQRGIVVQLEMWATYDIARPDFPYNPENNVSLDETNTGFRQVEDYHDTQRLFYAAIPELGGDPRLLEIQRAFVDKVLSYSFQYDNILYCMDNEYNWPQPPEWGLYWARYVRQAAVRAGKQIEVTELNQTDWGILDKIREGIPVPDADRRRIGEGWDYPFNVNHRMALDRFDVYSFVEFADNANTCEQEHWDNLQAVRGYIAGRPRPINHVKVYGADYGPRWPSTEGVDLFWRNVVGGAASVRFHRPPMGLGLSQLAQASIRALREFQRWVTPWECEPRMDLLRHREANEAYLTCHPGVVYGLYFSGRAGPGAWVLLLAPAGRYTVRWLDVGTGEWIEERSILTSERKIILRCPPGGSEYGRAVALVREA